MPVRGLNGKGVVGVSENIENTAVAGEQVESSEVEEQGFKAPASQDELDRIIQKRVARVEARYEGFDDLKAKAEKAAELESVAADLRKRVEQFESRDARSALVKKVAEDNGVDADLLGEMRGDSEEDLISQAKRLADRLKPTSSVIPGQAKSPENAPSDPLREFARQLFNKD